MESHKTGSSPIECLAAKTDDEEVRRNSSSGGVFTLLAEKILNQGGVVFGARFNDRFQVVHSYTETLEGLGPFRGSKYSQSDLNNCLAKAKFFLKEGRPVLFTGTPCQIAGLHGFLQKDYENLYSVSVVCHGAPSPKVWESYLRCVLKGEKAKSINMRSKDTGWKNYSLKIETISGKQISQPAMSTSFMKAFIGDLILRPSCYSCPFRGSHGSDITMGDFWGIDRIHPGIDDDLGTSFIAIYSEKGARLIKDLKWKTMVSSYSEGLLKNPSIEIAPEVPPSREFMMKKYRLKGYRTFEKWAGRKNKPNLIQKGFRRMKHILKNLVEEKGR